MSAADQPRSGRLVGGRYRLGARRGSGIEVAVFEAIDERLTRPVVIKLVHPSLYDTMDERELLREGVRNAVAIRHPNLGQIFDWGETDWDGQQVMFIVEEHLTGGSLRELLDRGRRLSPSQALLIGLDACRALDAVHRSGGWHGDIRPASLVFGDDRRLRVIDYGLAGPLAANLFANLSLVSKDRAMYAAPEVAAGAPHHQAADVYSLCLSLVESVTGRLPFVGDSAVATLANRIGKLLPVSADLGPLAPVFERAGRPDPSERSTAAEFGRSLMQTAEKLPRPAPIQLLGTGLFSDNVAPGQPVDPTGPLRRNPGATQAVPLVVEPPPTQAIPVTELPNAPVRQLGDTASSSGDIAGDSADDRTTAVGADVGGDATAAADAPASDEPDFDEHPPSHTAMRGEPLVITAMSDDAPVGSSAALPPTVVLPTSDSGARLPDGSPGAVPLPSTAGSSTRGLSRRALAGIVGAILVGGFAISWLLTNPTIKTLPTVVGLTEGEALNALKPLGFTTTVLSETNDDVPAGRVIRSQPDGGTKVDLRDPITLVVSLGPAPRELPELTDMTFAQASSALNDLGLEIEETAPEFSETVAKGRVVGWSVPELPTLVAGDQVAKGTVVRITLSLGPAPRAVPSLVGLTIEEAEAALTDIGLSLTTSSEVFSAEVAAGKIAVQQPAASAEVERGAVITVALSKGPELAPLPALIGMTIDQARVTLANAGFVEGPISGDPAGTVSAVNIDGKEVAAGAQVPKGSTVSLRFAPPATTTAPGASTTSAATSTSTG